MNALVAGTFSFAHDYIIGFMVGWVACTLFFTFAALRGWLRPH